MAKASLKSVSKMMKGIDLCMLTTVDGRGTSSSRPMSNNGDVDYDGDSYFFTMSDTKMVKDIKKNNRVSLQMESKALLKQAVWIAVSGTAEIITDREVMEEHWNPSLDYWFEDGLDTRGVVMLRVRANRIKYWARNKEGEYTPSKSR